MSLVASRLSLTHRTTVQRDVQAGTNAWGGKGTPEFQDHLTDLACRYWVETGHEQTDATSQVVVEDMRLIVPIGTDITEKDRLGDITSRGTTIVTGPVGIRAVLAMDDHLELVLVRLS
jgi:hypothetical protein